MFWIQLFTAWLIRLISNSRHKHTLQKTESPSIDQQQTKIVVIGKDEKSNENYIVSIEKRSVEV